MLTATKLPAEFPAVTEGGDVMSTLDLSDAEKQLITNLLEREMESLATEIHHTDTPSFKEELREKRETVRGLLERLTPVPA